jgi:hypothetical protein
LPLLMLQRRDTHRQTNLDHIFADIQLNEE